MKTLKQFLSEASRKPSGENFIKLLKTESPILKSLFNKGFIALSSHGSDPTSSPYVVLTYHAQAPDGPEWKDWVTVYYSPGNSQITNVVFHAKHSMKPAMKRAVTASLRKSSPILGDIHDESKSPLTLRLINSIFNPSALLGKQAAKHGWLRVLEIIFTGLYKLSNNGEEVVGDAANDRRPAIDVTADEPKY